MPRRRYEPNGDLLTRNAFGAACLALALVGAIAAPPADQTAGATPAWTAFTRTWAGIAGYSATVTVFEQKGVRTQHLLLAYTYHKPANATVHVVAGANAGVTLVWSGGSTLQAHRGSGLIAQFKKTFSLDDPLTTTIRGSSIDQLSFDAILAHAQQTPGMVSQSAGAPVDGVATDEVKLVPTTATTSGLTLEVVDISKTTHLPMRILGYEGPILVRDLEFSQVTLKQL